MICYNWRCVLEESDKIKFKKNIRESFEKRINKLFKDKQLIK